MYKLFLQVIQHVTKVWLDFFHVHHTLQLITSQGHFLVGFSTYEMKTASSYVADQKYSPALHFFLKNAKDMDHNKRFRDNNT